MTDAPERISLMPGDGWSWCEGRPVHEEDAVEYIRADLAAPQADLEAHIGAVLDEAEEQIRMQLWRHDGSDGYSVGMDAGARHQNDVDASAILGLRPDAMQALERAKRKARVEGMRAAAHIAVNACLVPPDGGSPTEEERLVCEEAYRRIMAAALIAAEERGEGE